MEEHTEAEGLAEAGGHIEEHAEAEETRVKLLLS
jgi:hypothetical protein